MSNPLLRALDRAIDKLTAPQNGPPSRPPGRPVAEPPATKPPSTFKGVTQAGTLDSPELGVPPSPVAVRELHPKIRPALPKNVLDGVPYGSPQTAAALCAAACTAPVLRSEEKKALDAVDAKWMRLSAALTEQLRITPNQRYARHLEQVADKIADGESGDAQDGWTREDWQQDHSEKVSALKRPMRQLELQAWAVVQPAYQRVAAEIDAFVDTLEDEEKATAARFCLPYTPSNTILRLRKVAHTFATADHSGVGRPASMVDALPR